MVEAYEALDFRAVVRTIVEVSQSANQFLQARAPWAKMKSDPEVARADLSDVSDVVALLATFLAPIVPSVTEKLFAQLGTAPVTFADLGQRAGARCFPGAARSARRRRSSRGWRRRR